MPFCQLSIQCVMFIFSSVIVPKEKIIQKAQDSASEDNDITRVSAFAVVFSLWSTPPFSQQAC